MLHPYRSPPDPDDDEANPVHLARVHWEEARSIRRTLTLSLPFWMLFLLTQTTRGIAVAAVITLACTRFEEWRLLARYRRLGGAQTPS